MSGYLEYKGYQGTIDYTAEDNVLFGKVIGINSLLSYEGDSLEAIRQDFMDAIDDYLSICEEKGLEPEKPKFFEGSELKTA